ncbi:hypothetical protein A1O3_06059, partial [Capronia epimyces CBS 606.96]
GYLKYIDKTQGEILSRFWDTGHTNKQLRKNLYRSLSQVISRIGRVISLESGHSLIIEDQGFLHLRNRPLTLEIQDLEKDTIPLHIPPSL